MQLHPPTPAVIPFVQLVLLEEHVKKRQKHEPEVTGKLSANQGEVSSWSMRSDMVLFHPSLEVLHPNNDKMKCE